MEAEIIILLLLTGSFAGFLAGLLGIGGGLVVVPIVLWVANFQELPAEHVQHIAVGTSFGVMIFTTLASMITQQKQKAIDWTITKFMVGGSVLGTILGSIVASYISGKNLQILFVIFCYIVAFKVFIKKEDSKKNKPDIKPLKMSSFGGFVGFISSILGIGGGVLNVPFLIHNNITIEKAVGISSAISFFIGTFGFIGYTYSGWNIEGLPPYSFGYCNIPIAVCLAVTSIIFAPIGVKTSHKLPKKVLQTSFSILMMVVATKILMNYF